MQATHATNPTPHDCCEQREHDECTVHIDYVNNGLDHGVGHLLLLLYDAKASHCRKNKAFKGLGHSAEWPKVADAVIKATISRYKPYVLKRKSPTTLRIPNIA